MKRILLLAIGILFAGAPNAFAGAWSAVTPVGPAGAHGPQVGVSDTGETVVAWTSGNSGRGRVEVSIRPPGGLFAAHQVVSGPIGLNARLLRLVVSERGDTLVLFDREQTLWAAFRPAGGSFGPPEHVADVSSHDVQAAIDADGDAVALWAPSFSGEVRVRAAARPAAGPFEPPHELSSAGVGPVLAMDASGNAIATWWEEGVQVSERPAGGQWGSTRRLDTSLPASSEPTLAVGPRGDAVVVWWTSGQTAYPPYFANQPDLRQVVASTRASGGDFSAPVVLADAADNAYQRRPEQTAASVDPNGHIAVGWERPEPRSIEVALRPANGGFLPPERLAGTEGYAERSIRLAFAGGSLRATVFWDVDKLGLTRRYSVERRRTGWSSPVVVADYEHKDSSDRYDPRFPFEPVVDFDLAGAATAVWPDPGSPGLLRATYDPNAPDPPVAEITSMQIEPRRFFPRRRRRGGTKIIVEATAPTDLALVIRGRGSTSEEPGFGAGPYIIRRHLRAGQSKIRFSGVVETQFGSRELEPWTYDVWALPTGPGPVGEPRKRSLVIRRR